MECDAEEEAPRGNDVAALRASDQFVGFRKGRLQQADVLAAVVAGPTTCVFDEGSCKTCEERHVFLMHKLDCRGLTRGQGSDCLPAVIDSWQNNAQVSWIFLFMMTLCKFVHEECEQNTLHEPQPPYA